jgi:thiol-disulfide isomerase/thioredoxin
MLGGSRMFTDKQKNQTLQATCKFSAAFIAVFFSLATTVCAETTNATQTWQALTNFSLPSPPAEWHQKRPTADEYANYQLQQAKTEALQADLARDFYTHFPDDINAPEAQKMELYALEGAVSGSYGKLDYLLPRVEKLEATALQNPKLPEDERFDLRNNIEHRNHSIHKLKTVSEFWKNEEDMATTLQKEFPHRSEPYEELLRAANNVDETNARRLAKEIIGSPAPDEIKAAAQTLIAKFDSVGKPLQIKFTALDGREVDLSKMSGKVVLVDFWATWCGPCVAELPNVKAAYDKLHAKGFEVIGISFDTDKSKLDHFIADKQMPWSQFFDGQGWQNKFGRQFGIDSIPTQWLVDKNGNLRDLNGRDNLEEKVEKLLAE